jgi:ssRNA-specific RNase YbeY (16S rRNA maturation enzyme)
MSSLIGQNEHNVSAKYRPYLHSSLMGYDDSDEDEEEESKEDSIKNALRLIS